MFFSQETKELFEALSKAQGEFKPVPFDKVNPHFKNKYASLSATQETVRPVLAKYGLSVIQAIHNSNAKEYELHTILAHSSGQQIHSKVDLILQRGDMQGLGSALTYAKRYALQSILGIAGDDDDDGTAAAESAKKSKSSQKENAQKQSNDPKDFVLRIGSKNDGKSLGELDRDTLEAVLKWCKSKMDEKPEPKNIRQIRYLYGCAKKVLEGMPEPDPSHNLATNEPMPEYENDSQMSYENENPFDDFREPEDDEKDLGLYVIKLKEVKELDGVFGRQLKEFEPQALQDILKVLDHKLQEIPKVKNSTDLFIVKTKIQAYLKTF